MKKLLLLSGFSLLCFQCVFSQTADKITVLDNRSINDPPTFFNQEVRFDFKLNGFIGAVGSGYSGVMTFAPWADNSGCKSHQLNFNEQGLYWRLGLPDASSWEAWRKIVTETPLGNVGIGTSSPGNVLSIERVPSSPSSSHLLFGDPTAVSGQSSAKLTFAGSGIYNAGFAWVPNIYPNQGKLHLAFGYSSNPMENNIGVTFKSNGAVGIGTQDPDAMLTVKGDIHTKEVRVDMTGSMAGPDYVFEKNYDLLSLSELETYINQNKHLPEVPSAKEMEKDGLNLKEMNLILLKKVEELTLHLIEAKKEIKDLQKKYNNLSDKQN